MPQIADPRPAQVHHTALLPTDETLPAEAVAYQSVRIARGNHASPRDGVCVMELASMLAGERFTDRPQSVSPIVSAFMRAYNDATDDAGRQELYAYASKAVGTNGSAAVEHRRAERCLEALHSFLGGGLLSRLAGRFTVPSSRRGREELATRLARDLHRYGRGAEAAALADELMAMRG
jgi:hypothetical protein